MNKDLTQVSTDELVAAADALNDKLGRRYEEDGPEFDVASVRHIYDALDPIEDELAQREAARRHSSLEPLTYTPFSSLNR